VRALERAERDGEVRGGQFGEQRAIVGGDPARQIDRDTMPRGPHQPPRRVCDVVVERAGEAGAEQRVDQQRRRCCVAQRLDRAAPYRACGLGGVGPRLARGRDADADATLGKPARDDIAVTAIVAGAAQHQRLERTEAIPGEIGGGAAGAVHQLGHRNTAREDRVLCGPGLGGGQDRAPVHRLHAHCFTLIVSGGAGP